MLMLVLMLNDDDDGYDGDDDDDDEDDDGDDDDDAFILYDLHYCKWPTVGEEGGGGISGGPQLVIRACITFNPHTLPSNKYQKYQSNKSTKSTKVSKVPKVTSWIKKAPIPALHYGMIFLRCSEPRRRIVNN